MSLRREIWKDGKFHLVYRDDRGIFREAYMKNVEVVDWIMKDWVNRVSKPFDPEMRKMYI